jgi:hypothetical protein
MKKDEKKCILHSSVNKHYTATENIFSKKMKQIRFARV